MISRVTAVFTATMTIEIMAKTEDFPKATSFF